MASRTIATRTDPGLSAGVTRDGQSLIKAICDEHRKSLAIMETVKRHHGEFIASRWRMGRLIAEAVGDRAKYGDGMVARLSEATGLHQNTIYECRKFATTIQTERALKKWITTTGEREGVVLWKNVRDLIWERDDVSMLGLEGAVERRLNNVEKGMQRLGQEMADTIRLAQSRGVGADLREQAVGVASKFLDMAQEAAAPIEIKGPPRDGNHTQFIREMDCYWCGATSTPDAPSHPDHYEMFGEADKGSDFSQVPACWKCHGGVHKEGRDSWARKRGKTWSQAIADVLHFRFTGRFIEWRGTKD